MLPKLYTDGSTYNNGKPYQESYIAVVDGHGQLITHTCIGSATISEAEYAAVIVALRYSQLKQKPFSIFTDSKLVVAQVNGEWRVKEPRLKPLCDQATKLMHITKSTVEWISRDDNLAGHHFEQIQKQGL